MLTISPALTVFMVVMTNFLLLIGAGLFSKAIWSFQSNAFNHLYVSFLKLAHRQELAHAIYQSWRRD